MAVYIVETETGSSEQGNAMLLDSVWSTYDLAYDYCAKFRKEKWRYDITEYFLDIGN